MTWLQLANVAIIIDIASQLIESRDARGVFRTQSNIYDGAVLQKQLTAFTLFNQQCSTKIQKTTVLHITYIVYVLSNQSHM